MSRLASVSDVVFLGNVLSYPEPAVAGLVAGSGVIMDNGLLAPHQNGTDEDECIVPHKPMWALWSEPRLDCLLQPGSASSRRTLRIADGMAYFASGLNGDVLCRFEIGKGEEDDGGAGKEEADEVAAEERSDLADVERIQTFPPGQPIRVIDLNATLLVACSNSFVAVFARSTLQRLALVEAKSLPSAHVTHTEHGGCRIVDVSVPPDRFGARSKREVLVMLSCGALLAVNFVENRISYLHSLACDSKKNPVINVRYLSHSRQFVVLLQRQLVWLDLTMPWDLCFRILCTCDLVKRSFHALAVSTVHAYLVAVAATDETLIWDTRFDSPLLRRLVPATYHLESLLFEDDCVVGASGNGLLVMHQLEIGNTALFWKGPMSIAKSIVYALNSPLGSICGVALLKQQRLFVATSVGHIFEQGFDSRANAPPDVMGRLVTLLVGHHNAAPEVLRPQWLAQEEEQESPEVEVELDEGWLGRDELPQVMRADLLDQLDKRWAHNAEGRKRNKQ